MYRPMRSIKLLQAIHSGPPNSETYPHIPMLLPRKAVSRPWIQPLIVRTVKALSYALSDFQSAHVLPSTKQTLHA